MMSGYSISNYTLYKDIYTLCAGQYVEITTKIRSKFYLKFFLINLLKKILIIIKKNILKFSMKYLSI